MSREALLVRTLVELADTLVDDFDVVEALTVLADRCVELLGISAAGVMLGATCTSLTPASTSPSRPSSGWIRCRSTMT